MPKLSLGVSESAEKIDWGSMEEVLVKIRPWIRMDGSLNRRVLDRYVSSFAISFKGTVARVFRLIFFTEFERGLIDSDASLLPESRLTTGTIESTRRYYH